MRKLICLAMMGILATGLGIGVIGCSEETKVESKTTTSTPDGKSTVTDTHSVKTSGDNPPTPKAP
jgi:formylmethanofuran:tetrahydromethanopterin formyltransferase